MTGVKVLPVCRVRRARKGREGATGETIEVTVSSAALPLERLFPFPLDDFQRSAIASIDAGRNVVVCAPTGAGKTVVAEYAVHLALARAQRCFYTTPLKALSNQKFFDFRAGLGDDRVGLLTGDTSVQRDSSVVVMTTEVFRNMLYGTTLGEVSRNLQSVRFVVLDECHFMNDVERGTVWEESVIYAPRDVQLVALSATIANAEELVEWMRAVHGPTDLAASDHRPVPLRHYYYVKSNLFRLLDPDRKLNPALTGVTGTPAHPGSRARGGRHLPGDRSRGAHLPPKPEYDAVCRILDKKGMLPAIFFVFSRKGCEESLRHSTQAIALTRVEEQAMHDAITDALARNPTLASHPHLPYLYQGVAAHHAGLLPSWKSLVERLFVQGLVKVVFATETLAAGINMPARTTIISAISKRADEGHRVLSASEFLQMSGRAGRRGMDTVGNVVVLSHPRETVEEAGRLARARPDPLVSQFTPSYGMVLNLLQKHRPEECYDLLERSFGQFLSNRASAGLQAELRAADAALEALSRPLCPNEIGDLVRYAGLYEQLRAVRKQVKGMRRGLERAPAPALREAAGDLQRKANALLEEARAMPCHGCPVQEPCACQEDDLRKVHNRKAEVLRRQRRASTPYRRQFQDLAAVLESAGYLRKGVPTAVGRMAAALRATNVLFLAEVIRSGLLDALDAEDAAAVITAVITEETRRMDTYVGVEPSEGAVAALQQVVDVARQVDRQQRRHSVEVPVIVNPVYCGLSQAWARGASWEEMRTVTSFDEGDVVRSLRRTVDLARQVARAPEVPQATAAVCARVEELLSRDEVREEFLASQVPTDVLHDMEEHEPIDPLEVLEEMLEEDDI